MDRRVEIVLYFVTLTVTAEDFDQGARSRELLLEEGRFGIVLPLRSRERYPVSEKPLKSIFLTLTGIILFLTETFIQDNGIFKRCND